MKNVENYFILKLHSYKNCVVKNKANWNLEQPLLLSTASLLTSTLAKYSLQVHPKNPMFNLNPHPWSSKAASEIADKIYRYP